jgi:hypothetical protein
MSSPSSGIEVHREGPVVGTSKQEGISWICQQPSEHFIRVCDLILVSIILFCHTSFCPRAIVSNSLTKTVLYLTVKEKLRQEAKKSLL